jgi:hypothetical protein
MQSLSSVIHLLGVTVLAYCFARRTSFPDLSWNQLWSTITWPRLCVILVLADSWIFVFLCEWWFVAVVSTLTHIICSGCLSFRCRPFQERGELLARHLRVHRTLRSQQDSDVWVSH